MSGRSLHLRDGKLITNRKTDRRQAERTPPDLMPDWRVTLPLPGRLAFSVSAGMPTGIIGVEVGQGPAIEARGKNWEWVYRQAGEFLARIAKGWQGRIAMRVERDAYPGLTQSGPLHPAIDRTQDVLLITEPSFVVTRPFKDPLIFPVKA